MFHPVQSTKVIDFKGCKLVVVSRSISSRVRGILSYTVQPCVSVGNVAQLSIDLLITTLKMERIGHLCDQSLLPLVCQSAFDHNTGVLNTSGEGAMCWCVCHVSC